MKIKHCVFTMLSIFLLAFAFAPGLLAQEPEPQEPQEPQVQIFQGELLSVDPDTNIIVVRQADGTEMEFSFDEQTEISGAGENPEGLATFSGTQVVVHYRTNETGTYAVRIEVT